MKYFLSVIFFEIISIMVISCSAQKQGYVVTNVNDTIKGKFKLAISPESAAYGAPKVFALYNSKNIKTDISTDSIKKINIVKRGMITDSYIIYDNDFWQLLSVKDSLSIYKKNYKKASKYTDYSNFSSHGTNITSVTNEYSTDKYLDIAIFSGDIQKTEIYNDLQNYNVTIIGKEVLEFINTRYKLNYTFKDLHIDQRTDFVHQQKLFDLILKLEDSAKIQDAPPINL